MRVASDQHPTSSQNPPAGAMAERGIEWARLHISTSLLINADSAITTSRIALLLLQLANTDNTPPIVRGGLWAASLVLEGGDATSTTAAGLVLSVVREELKDLLAPLCDNNT